MLSPCPCAFSLIGDSVIRKAVRETIRGKMAVIPNTPLVPKLSIKEPLKYALAIPPTADDPQHNDCRDPATACRITGSAMLTPRQVNSHPVLGFLMGLSLSGKAVPFLACVSVQDMGVEILRCYWQYN